MKYRLMFIFSILAVQRKKKHFSLNNNNNNMIDDNGDAAKTEKRESLFILALLSIEIRWFSSIFSIVPFVHCNRIYPRYETRLANKVEIKTENEIPLSSSQWSVQAPKKQSRLLVVFVYFFHVKRFVLGFVALTSNLLIMFAHLHLDLFFKRENTQNLDVYLFSLRSSPVFVICLKHFAL